MPKWLVFFMLTSEMPTVFAFSMATFIANSAATAPHRFCPSRYRASLPFFYRFWVVSGYAAFKYALYAKAGVSLMPVGSLSYRKMIPSLKRKVGQHVKRVTQFCLTATYQRATVLTN